MQNNIAYIRVSTEDQKTGRQHEVLKSLGIKIDKIFEEKVSGKSTENRPQLQAMLDYVREDDVIYIESISRLARNTVDFLKIVEFLNAKKVGLISAKEKIDTTTPQGKFMITVFAALSELEREYIRQRQREGIDLCLKEGRKYGRPRETYSKDFIESYNKWKNHEISTKDFMANEGITARSTFYDKIKRYEERKQKK